MTFISASCSPLFFISCTVRSEIPTMLLIQISVSHVGTLEFKGKLQSKRNQG